MTWCLGKLYISRYYCLEYLLSEVISNFIHNLLG